MRRYQRDKVIRGGKMSATNQTIRLLRQGLRSGTISVEVYKTKEGDRLDQIAGKKLGDSKLWWILATLSGIGWSLQVPPGTRILIPTRIDQIKRFVG